MYISSSIMQWMLETFLTDEEETFNNRRRLGIKWTNHMSNEEGLRKMAVTRTDIRIRKRRKRGKADLENLTLTG